MMWIPTAAWNPRANPMEAARQRPKDAPSRHEQDAVEDAADTTDQEDTKFAEEIKKSLERLLVEVLHRIQT